jgi:hypothetical protein
VNADPNPALKINAGPERGHTGILKINKNHRKTNELLNINENKVT